MGSDILVENTRRKLGDDAMPKPPVEGPLTLERWKRETPQQHRAFLMWVMMSERATVTGRANKQRIKGRSCDVIAKIAKVAQQTVSYWLKTRKWVERLESYESDDAARRDAWVLYRAVYFEQCGRVDLPLLEPYMEARFQDMDWTKPKALKELDEVMGRIVQTPSRNEKDRTDRAVKATKTALDEAEERKRKEIQAYKAVVRKSIRFYNEQLEAGKVKVRPSDLKTLMQVLRDLEGEEYALGSTAAPEATESAPIEDSARVRFAKARHPRGTDAQNAIRDRAILDAHLETCEEALLFLRTQARLLRESDENADQVAQEVHSATR